MEQEIKEYIGIISKAITDNRLLVFDYINRDMEYLERTVEPSWIDFRHGDWYVIGFCRVREDYRRFKLVRIKQLKQGPPFAKRELPEDQIAEVIKQSYSQRDIQVVLRFTSRIGAQLPEYFEKEKISRREDGFYLVTDTYPYEEGLLKFILSFGKECELLEPRELRTELQQYMQNMLLSYND
ncbi:YafY family protein [Paenibacillus sp. IHB B 3415]|uniref:helix-turn-helix transcriptional regulator n=1 Tax=Paenibacillus sp. IHB B 3415 TaxID=867080 RepID=UPI001F180C3E|nr:WYL domain-containing protein [Paenibacillus sp. IHB B 3415]